MLPSRSPDDFIDIVTRLGPQGPCVQRECIVLASLPSRRMPKYQSVLGGLTAEGICDHDQAGGSECLANITKLTRINLHTHRQDALTSSPPPRTHLLCIKPDGRWFCGCRLYPLESTSVFSDIFMCFRISFMLKVHPNTTCRVGFLLRLQTQKPWMGVSNRTSTQSCYWIIDLNLLRSV